MPQNLELFFCLYADYWDNPSQCNSTHSRLLGFFSTLPSIWRALQCIRRYYDTRNIFPHLVNCGKYAMGIMFYVTLSLYRIQRNRSNLALFSTFAVVNSIYCCKFSSLACATLLMSRSNMGYRYGLVAIPTAGKPSFPPRCSWVQESVLVLLSHGSGSNSPLQLDLLLYLHS